MFTQVRVKHADYLRIKSHVERQRKEHRFGSFAQHDVITELLDVYDEKINQTTEKSNDSKESYDHSTK